MDPNTLAATPLGDPVAQTSILSMALDADPIVKIVMIVLIIASIWCWAVIIEKAVRFGRLRRQATLLERAFWSGQPLDDLYRRIAKRIDHPMALMFATGMDEWREAPRPTASEANEGLVSRIGRVMELTMDREVQTLERHLPSLATVGSVAPFIGLFGTVWGIMNSFQAIAATNNTSLAVVAPGIAEALFVTALGLLAAIPAVMAYNKLSGDLDRYAGRLASFADEFTVVVGRELDVARVS